MSSTGTRSRSGDSNSSRSRSSSHGRTRSNSRSSDNSYSSDYTDEFEQETKSEGAVTSHIRTVAKTKQKQKKKLYKSGRSTAELHSSISYGGYGNMRKKREWSSPSPPKTLKKNSIALHMMNAKQQEINELQNKLSHAKQKLSAAEKENKLLKTLQRRQDKALHKFESVDNDIPRLISRNFEDQRILKSQLRKTQDTKRALEEKLHENSQELQKMEGVLQRLKKMVYDKNLGERSELSKQLSNTENKFMVAERKVESLDKKLDSTITSYTRHLNNEMQKHKETREKMEKLHGEYLEDDMKLKEKERAIQRNNIYTLRQKELPEKALVPVANRSPVKRKEINSYTQTDLSLTLPQKTGNNELPSLDLTSPRNKTESQKVEELFSTSPKSSSRKEKRKEKRTSVFLTANFESPMSSPNTSFVKDVSDTSAGGTDEQSFLIKDTQHDSQSPDIQKRITQSPSEESEIDLEKKLAALKKKEDLLLNMQEIDDQTSPKSLLIPKLSSPQNSPKPRKWSPKSKAELVQSLLEGDNNENKSGIFTFTQEPPPVESTPKQPEREISFGSYAPTVGAIPPRRKAPSGSKASITSMASMAETDEPLLDLNSGKQNKKSDLLTQLFGNQDAVLVNGSNSLNFVDQVI